MSCLDPSYNPNPPRLWTRFENSCIFDTTSVPNYGADTNKLTMLYKGNILQYKKNSSNITKAQRYGQIARGMWTNRTTTWATQSQTYTNPNTQNLKRVNYSTIPNTNIPDGGVLICGTGTDTDTGTGTDTDKTMIDVLTNRCNPTSASDVPGPITELCYNDGQQTYYPKTKLTYGTSGNKWPVNYKIVKSANGIVAINTFP